MRMREWAKRESMYLPDTTARTRRARRNDEVIRNRMRRQLWLSTSQMVRRLERMEPSLANFPLYLNRQGFPIGLKWFTRYKQDARYQRVARTRINADLIVSTIWDGMNVNPFGAPPLFETAILQGDDVTPVARWMTEAEAFAGHALVVKLAKAGKLDEIYGLDDERCSDGDGAEEDARAEPPQGTLHEGVDAEDRGDGST